jgi:aerobic carbon-monoxide dehydrogenase large subunit
MKPMKFGIGQSTRRVEDIKLITGAGQFTDDIPLKKALVGYVLRSPHAHATFTINGLESAKAADGVKLVLTASDLAHYSSLPCIAIPDGVEMTLPHYPVLAKDVVQHLGDAIAFIVADSLPQARAGAERLEVDYQSRPAVADISSAIASGAPQVWPFASGNIAYETTMGDAARTEAAFAKAAKVVSITVVNNRVVANYMETRAAIGEYNASKDDYTLTTGTQGVHNIRKLVSKIMGIAPANLHVKTPDVGGGFGTKSFVYREYALVLEAAKRLNRPVKWVSDRSEHFVSDAQGRDNLTTAQMALDEKGRFIGMKVDILGDLGAYLSTVAPYIPWLGLSMATGCYDVKAYWGRVRGVYTHTVPVDAYRGAGRPEAAYVLERLVDACAREMNIGRDVIRARNFIKPKQMPYKTFTQRTYDVGEFEAAMKAALEKADYKGFEKRAKLAKKSGKLRGIGFASYIECTAWGDGEQGSVELNTDGTFTMRVGTQSNGQGHATAYAQVVSHYLDVPLEQIHLIQGDSRAVPTGNGTGGSRSIPVGAAMLNLASEKLSVQLKDLAADMLEAAPSDVEISNGAIRIMGTDRAVAYADIAKSPKATPAKLKAIASYEPPEATYPNGTHVCEVEIDPDTGTTSIVNYNVVDDFGFILNPMLLAGQVHGGIGQGIGQALLERTVFNSEGQLLTATLMDYALPRADDVPSYQFETRNVPSTSNPLGLKGAGEAGSIGSSPAVMNAVADALYRGYGITHIDMPATPSAVFEAIRSAGGYKSTAIKWQG